MQEEYYNYLRNLKESTANKLYELLDTYYGAYIDDLGNPLKPCITEASILANEFYKATAGDETMENIRFFFLFSMANGNASYEFSNKVLGLIEAIEEKYRGKDNATGT